MHGHRQYSTFALFEVVGAREATGVCMQDLVFIRNRTFVCTCSADSSYLFVGRSD